LRVLLVDDNPDLVHELTEGLRGHGIDALAVEHGRAALTHYTAVDAVLLDLKLPDIDGFEICRLIRANSSVPVIIMSGRGDEFDQVLGLKMGADDYVVKPCRIRELTARIEAVVRRSRYPRLPWSATPVRDLGTLRVDTRLRRVTVHGTEVPLTRKEFDLLALLTSEPGRTFTREEIMKEVWGYDGAGDTRTLGVHMSGLRKKLGAADVIETVRGVGFRIAD
jgi:two-component system, OmpR family, response regulator RegX3